MIKNLEEKKKIIELLTVSMASVPMTPSKDFMLLHWYRKWHDFSDGNIQLKLYQGRLVKSKTKAKEQGAEYIFEYPELDAILQDTFNEYMNKYVNMKTRKKNFSKNIDVFAEDLKSYRKSCVDSLNNELKKCGSEYSAVNTSTYLKNHKRRYITKGMLQLAKYSVFYQIDDTHRKELFRGSYEDVIDYIENYIQIK